MFRKINSTFIYFLLSIYTYGRTLSIHRMACHRHTHTHTMLEPSTICLLFYSKYTCNAFAKRVCLYNAVASLMDEFNMKNVHRIFPVLPSIQIRYVQKKSKNHH